MAFTKTDLSAVAAPPLQCSAIYGGIVRLDRIGEGFISHCREQPVAHEFRYRIWMLLADVDRLDALAATSALLSVDRFNLLSIRPRACLPDWPGNTVRERANSAIRAAGHPIWSGPMLLLQQPASWGAGFNPVRFVFCLDESGRRIEYVLGEINNTPWGERHTYVLRAKDPAARVEFEFDKAFHVSPFNPMAQRYRWTIELEEGRIGIAMSLWQRGRVVFRSGLALRTAPVTARALRRAAFRHAAQPLVHLLRIYRQAALLWLRGAVFHHHPKRGVHP
jgi:DUF1365 family protein